MQKTQKVQTKIFSRVGAANTERMHLNNIPRVISNQKQGVSLRWTAEIVCIAHTYKSFQTKSKTTYLIG